MLTALYSMYYCSLVRLAAVLVGEVSGADEIVQDSFVALHAAASRTLADSDRALSFLRRSVLNRCRAALQRHSVADRLAQRIARGIPGAAQQQTTLFERSVILSALRALPPRQREVLVLRYYAGLSEAEIASTLGISTGAVRSHTAWAMSALHAELQQATE